MAEILSPTAKETNDDSILLVSKAINTLFTSRMHNSVDIPSVFAIAELQAKNLFIHRIPHVLGVSVPEIE